MWTALSVNPLRDNAPRYAASGLRFACRLTGGATGSSTIISFSSGATGTTTPRPDRIAGKHSSPRW